MSVPLLADSVNALTLNDIPEMKNMLIRIKGIEEQAEAIISRMENNKTTWRT